MDILARISHQIADIIADHDTLGTPDADLVGTEEGHLVLIVRAGGQIRDMVTRAGRVPDAAEREDLLQAAMMGYLEALKKFDPTRGTQPFTYAYPAIHEALRDANRSASPKPARRDDHERYHQAMTAMDGNPVDAREWSRLQRLRGWEVQREADNGNHVAEQLITRRIYRWENQGRDVATMMHAEEGRGRGLTPLVFDAIHARVTYLDVTTPCDDDNDAPLYDTLEADDSQKAHNHAENTVAVQQLLTHLDDRERTVITAFYGLEGRYEHKAQEVADEIGVSRSRVLNIRKAALGKLAKVAA